MNAMRPVAVFHQMLYGLAHAAFVVHEDRRPAFARSDKNDREVFLDDPPHVLAAFLGPQRSRHNQPVGVPLPERNEIAIRSRSRPGGVQRTHARGAAHAARHHQVAPMVERRRAHSVDDVLQKTVEIDAAEHRPTGKHADRERRVAHTFRHGCVEGPVIRGALRRRGKKPGMRSGLVEKRRGLAAVAMNGRRFLPAPRNRNSTRSLQPKPPFRAGNSSNYTGIAA